MKNMFLACALFCMSSVSFAQNIQGISFTKDDWEIYCSNTGTCRAAGYQSDERDLKPASILLTRRAGAHQLTTVQFALGELYGDEEQLDPNKMHNIHFFVNSQDLGVVTFHDSDSDPAYMGKLSQAQADVLLKSAMQHSSIVFKNKNYTWQISDAGMSAVLLKMDDFQKRVGTVGALIKKGSLDESKVLAAQPKLHVTKLKIAEKPYLVLKPKSKQYDALYTLLMSAKNKPKNDDSCEGIYGESDKLQKQDIELYQLSGGKVLATTLCWRGAYNEGLGVWMLDHSLTGSATLITDSASGIDDNVIDSSQKGRGIGDCWSSEEWVWDGKRIVQTKNMWTGMCKGLAAGGVWQLDQIEAIVK